jgi:MEDS: MEthanogen/methylotroph, DcmR Sensory domain
VSHRLHLFDTPETLGHTVAAFLVDGYEAGEHLVIIAKPRHRDAVLSSLRTMGCFPETGDGAQRLVVFDAAEVLRHITRNGIIDATLFRKTINPLLQSLSETARPRIYGEAVELLAEMDDMAGALKLEQLWNELAKELPLTLMCGYSSAHFTGECGQRALRGICEAHTQSLATDEDPLGSYLLALA